MVFRYCATGENFDVRKKMRSNWMLNTNMLLLRITSAYTLQQNNQLKYYFTYRYSVQYR